MPPMPELVSSDGTWIVPSELSPRCSSFESTPMAGISTDTGSERGSDGPRADEPDNTRCRRRRLRRVHLGGDGDAHGGGPGRDEQDAGEPGHPRAQASCRGWAAGRSQSPARRRPRGTRLRAATPNPAMSPSLPQDVLLS